MTVLLLQHMAYFPQLRTSRSSWPTTVGSFLLPPSPPSYTCSKSTLYLGWRNRRLALGFLESKELRVSTRLSTPWRGHTVAYLTAFCDSNRSRWSIISVWHLTTPLLGHQSRREQWPRPKTNCCCFVLVTCAFAVNKNLTQNMTQFQVHLTARKKSSKKTLAARC